MEEAQESGGGIRSALPLGSLISPSGNEVELPELEGKTIGLYFRANGTPQVARPSPRRWPAAYRQLRGRGAGFRGRLRVVRRGPAVLRAVPPRHAWPSVPFGDIPCKKSLSDMFQVEGIPRLVVLAPDGRRGRLLRRRRARAPLRRPGVPLHPGHGGGAGGRRAEQVSLPRLWTSLFSVSHARTAATNSSPSSRAWWGRRWGSTSRRTGASRASSSPRGWPPSTAI
ncbi:putative nucleoredoxin 2 [Hordeum vulgare]|nr:putative nucleoredoxin 2 [Hordeum vulgare]